MQKKERREREAKLWRRTKRYPSDLTDIEWVDVEPLMPRIADRGRRRQCDLREVVNALRYLATIGMWLVDVVARLLATANRVLVVSAPVSYAARRCADAGSGVGWAASVSERWGH